MTSQFSIKCNKNHNKTFDDLKKPIEFDYQLCGNLSQFQQQISNLPTIKEILFSKQERIKRKLSFGDEIKTNFPSELSQIESENGRRIRQNDRSISINIQVPIQFEYIYLESSTKTKRKSCECSECGKLNPFQIKYQEISILRKDRKIKQFLIKSKPKLQQYGQTEFQIINNKVIQCFHLKVKDLFNQNKLMK